MSEEQHALVIGASSGIGAACVQELTRRGFKVTAVARRKERLQEVCTAANTEGPGSADFEVHDLRKPEEVPELFEKIVRDAGRLDLVLYAAGAMPRITPETYDFEKDREVIEVNVLGAMAWLNQAAPHLGKQGHGRIIGISSIAGDRGRKGFPAYCSSKAALDTFLESLRNRLGTSGVSVTTIKPGFIATAMTEGMEGLFWVKTPEEAARSIVKAGLAGKRQRYVPLRWGFVGFVIKRIPSFIFKKLDI